MIEIQISRRVRLSAALFMAVAATPCAFGQSSGSPAVLDTSKPIVVRTSKPKSTNLTKFVGYVQLANIAQITLRAKGNDASIQTFSLNQQASEKMQKIVDSGGYQYGDKVTVYYDPATRKAFKFKGKPSRPV